MDLVSKVYGLHVDVVKQAVTQKFQFVSLNIPYVIYNDRFTLTMETWTITRSC